MLRLTLVLVSCMCWFHGEVLSDSLSNCSVPRCAEAYGCRTYITKDWKGCSSGCGYSCGSPWCGLRHCPRPCIHGYVQDSMGCNTCRCVNECQDVPCGVKCQQGYVQDRTGCSVCECRLLEFPSCLAYLNCYQGLCPDSF